MKRNPGQIDKNIYNWGANNPLTKTTLTLLRHATLSQSIEWTICSCNKASTSWKV